MSRIRKKPIPVPAGVDASVSGQTVQVKGSKGELTLEFPDFLSVKVEDGKITVDRTGDLKRNRAMHGTVRSLLSNMIEGVTSGFTKELEIQGVGFRAQLQGQKLTLNLGYSHPIDVTAPDGVNVEVKDGTAIKISGADKQAVGQLAAQIRSYYKAEPYKGKGVRYKGEQVRRKVGKAVA